MSLAQFSQTLAETPASVFIQSVGWIIPTLQTVHILAISIVLGSILLVDLRLLGLVGRGVALDAVVGRFATWLWWSLLVLAVTGSILVVGEPDRSLTNPVFQTKLVLVALAALATLAITRPVVGDPQFWTATPARLAAGRGLALVSLAIWLAVIVAGRWIAYAI